MTNELWIAIITSVFTFAGVLVTVIFGNKKQSKKVDEYKDLTVYRVSQLEKKVEKHNNLVERVYKLEGNIGELNQEMKSVRQHIINDK